MITIPGWSSLQAIEALVCSVIASPPLRAASCHHEKAVLAAAVAAFESGPQIAIGKFVVCDQLAVDQGTLSGFGVRRRRSKLRSRWVVAPGWNVSVAASRISLPKPGVTPNWIGAP